MTTIQNTMPRAELKPENDLSRAGKHYRNKMANMSDEERVAHREYERLKKQAQRQAKKESAPPPTEEQAETKRRKEKSTMERNYGNLELLSKQIQGEEFDGSNFEFITDNYESTFKFIEDKYSNLNTQKSKINAMLAYIREAEIGAEDDVGYTAREFFNTKLKEIQGKLSTAIKQNTMSERDEKAWQDWDDVMKMRPKLKDQQEKVVYDLYTMIPPQHLEYRNLRIRKGAAYPEGNTIVLNRKGAAERIVLREFKGDTKKEDITIPVPTKMRRYITTYMKKREVGPGDYLFPEEIRSRDTFSRYVSGMFEKYSGIPTTVNTLRKIYNTHMAKTDESYQDTEDRAKSMNTSVFQASTAYTKKKAPEDGVEEETPEERAERIFKEDEEIQKKREEDDFTRLADLSLKIADIVNSRKKTLKKIEDIQELHKSHGYGEIRTKELIAVFQENPDMDCALVEAILQWFE